MLRVTGINITVSPNILVEIQRCGVQCWSENQHTPIDSSKTKPISSPTHTQLFPEGTVIMATNMPKKFATELSDYAARRETSGPYADDLDVDVLIVGGGFGESTRPSLFSLGEILSFSISPALTIHSPINQAVSSCSRSCVSVVLTA